MKKQIAVVLLAGLMVLPLSASAQTDTTTSATDPVTVTETRENGFDWGWLGLLGLLGLAGLNRREPDRVVRTTETRTTRP